MTNITVNINMTVDYATTVDNQCPYPHIHWYMYISSAIMYITVNTMWQNSLNGERALLYQNTCTEQKVEDSVSLVSDWVL